MSGLICSNWGSANSLSPDPQIQSSDKFISQILRGSRQLLESDHGPIDNDIAKLKQFQSWYNIQLHAVLQSIENRKLILTPIYRLPRDNITEIFHSVCDSWRPRMKIDSLDINGPLWVLSSVCRRWRDILHTSPASWARSLSVRAPFSKHAPEILQTYLERTGDHPLSVMAICDSFNLAKDGKIMSILVQSSHRWRNARIHTRQIHMQHLESVLNFPILQTIEMDIYDADRSVADMCLKAPRLRQVILPNQGFEKFRLPSKITHYSGNITWVEGLQLFSQLLELKTCHLRFDEMWVTDGAPVLMAELRQLYVDDQDLLNLLTTPKLQSLTVAPGPNEFVLSPTIALFLRRCGCHLESLKACSMISYLKLEIDSADALTTILAPSSGLPNLSHLLLSFTEVYYHLETERLALLDAICSRCEAGQLKLIDISSEVENSTSHDMEVDIRAVIEDDVEVWAEMWSPLCQDYRDSFLGPELPEF